MLIPDTSARKITADFRAEKSMGAEKNFVTLWPPVYQGDLIRLFLFLIVSNITDHAYDTISLGISSQGIDQVLQVYQKIY